MSLRDTALYTLDTLNSGSGAGSYTKMIFTKDYRNAVYTFIAGGTASMTLKFYCSTQEARPDLSQSPSATNQYQLVQVIKLADGTAVPGNTGLVIAADGQQEVEINENAQTWLGIVVTTYATGNVIPTLFLANNQ